MLINDYWNNNLLSTDISIKYNYPSPCNITGKIFSYLDIPTRNCKETSILNFEKGKIHIPQTLKYKSEWYTTWNNKEVYLRSSYELDYAKELDEQKINYDVESLKIKYWDTKLNEYHCAIPDFYISDTNTIVEIKSIWTLDIQQMKDKVKAYRDFGYNFKLIVDHNEENIDNIIEIKNKQIIYKK